MAGDGLAWIDHELGVLEAGGLRRVLTVRQSPQRAVLMIDGKRYANFGSNDYLGLAAGPLDEVVASAVRRVGCGSGASPLVTGRGSLHAELEARLAAFEGTEAALLFPTGYAANVGTVSALVGPGDVVFSDAKNHASIVDGCRLSRAATVVYRHGDAHDLACKLDEHTGYRRRLIVTDGLFSMDGDWAPLGELADLAGRHEAMLMVDEAHATGVFGAGGRGVAEHLGVEARIPIRVGTLSKALGSHGGFVVGSRRLIDWLSNRARTYVYSTAAPEALAAAGLEALRIVAEEPWRRRQLLERAEWLRDQLRRRGWNVGSSRSQIIPLFVGDPREAAQLSAALRGHGYWVPAIRPPSVPPGESLLRLSLSHEHDAALLEGFLGALDRCTHS